MKTMVDNPIQKDLSKLPLSSRSARVYGNTRSFEHITSLLKLEELDIYSLSQKNTLQLSSLTGLKHLFLRWGGFTDLSFLRNLKSLTSLYIWQTSRLKTLDGIEALENLQRLTLFEAASTIRSLSLEPLRSLKQLHYLELRGPMNVDSLSPLVSLRNLNKLNLFTKVEDGSLAPLKEIPNLTELDMWILEKRYNLEELAVAAAIAPNLLDKWLDFQPWGIACKKCGTTKAALIGRGTHDFCPVCQPKRGEQFAIAFREMVKRHTGE